MDPTQLDDDQLDALAAQLAPRFPTGTHGDRVVLTKRQFAAASAGVLSAGALMALGVDEASAQAAGQQGTESSPNDMFAYNLDVQNGATFNGTDIEGVRSLSTGQANIKRQNGYVYADNYPTFDDAITALNDGDTLIMPNAEVTGSYTIDNNIAVTGPGAGFSGGINADITCNGRVRFHNVQFFNSPSLEINEQFSAVINCETPSGLTVNVNADDFRFSGGILCGVEFASGTSGGIVDASTGVVVTDNGTNTVGDIA